MSDEELRTTPLDQLLAMYGPGKKGNHGGRSLLFKQQGGRGGGGGGTGDCDSDFGVSLADRWRLTAKECCKPFPSGGPREAPQNATKLTCHLVKQNRHAGAGDQLLVGENVALSFKDLVKNDGAIPKKYFSDYVKTKHNQEFSKIKWSAGSMGGTCKPDASQGWQKQNFPGWNVDWFNAFESSKSQESGNLQCDMWVEEPTLLVERDTFANFFHNSEDFFNTFLSLAILKWPVQDLQVLLTDIFPKGPFMPMWSKVFRGVAGKSPDPLTAFEIARRFGSKRVCFKNLAVAILGAAAPMAVASWDTPCRGVALVRAYADFVVRGLGLQNVNKGRQRQDVNVTYAARRASVQWPEKAFCDTANSYFDCEQLNHLQMRKLGRMVRNDNAVVAGLRKLEAMSFPNGARVKVREVDFSLLSFEEQIAIDATTDVLIGPHGAGLMHNVFMADRAHLIELFVDGSSANRHFHNLAFWAGHGYRGEPQANPIAVERVVGMAHDAVASLDLSELPW